MNDFLNQEYVENFTFDEIQVGRTARLVRTLSLQDIQAFASVSGDVNPMHLNQEVANNSFFRGIIGHGMWSGALISTVLGTEFPGAGTIYLDQSLHFKNPVRVGDTVVVVLTVTDKDPVKKIVEFDCLVTNQDNKVVVAGQARVLAPVQKLRLPKMQAPQISLFDPDMRIKNLLALGSALEAVTCGVIHPCDVDSLRGAIQAAELNLIVPILIGPHQKIKNVADQANLDISQYKLIDVPHSHAAAEQGALLAATHEVETLMKGSLHTDELMHAVIARHDLRTKRRLSHVFRFELPLYEKPILITDAALNIRPTLDEKADIVQNAINLATIMGCSNPRVAVLSAIETINSSIPSTIEAAALCKMAERGQIVGGILDGPLAFDNAVSLHAAQIKHIHSPVAGHADILVVPDLESGNMLSKQLEYFAGGIGSGIVLGCKVPIALTSRADGYSTRMSSALLAKLIAHHYRSSKP